VAPVDYAEIVATVASASAGPGPRQHRRVHPHDRAAVEVIGGAARGKAIIILNPAEPPLIMRDTIYCSLPADADHGKVATSIHDMVDEVQTYVPGYRLRGEPQFDQMDDGGGRVATFLEVEGGGRLPAAVLRQPRHHDGGRDQGGRGDRTGAPDKGEGMTYSDQLGTQAMTYSDQLDVRVTDTSLRDGSHAKRHQFTEEHVRSIVAALDDAGMPVIEVTHGDGLGGSSYNYGFSQDDERVS
jgi:hypothetical protein